MKCFYHKSDFDGKCSAAIVKYTYPECELFGVDYNSVFDRSVVSEGESVFVVDFCFDREDMMFLHTNNLLTWLDHHKSSIEKMVGVSPTVNGVRDIRKAACELTWEYLQHTEPPLAVFLLGRYDVWDHEDDRVLPFQYGLRLRSDTMPASSVWNHLFSKDDVRFPYEIIRNGKLILEYQDQQNAIYAAGMAYEVEFEGLRAIVMNKAYANSKAFDSVYDPEKHDIMVLYGVKPGEYKYTLFCDKPELDVSEIAKKYGGGGHKYAAGFYSKTQLV